MGSIDFLELKYNLKILFSSVCRGSFSEYPSNPARNNFFGHACNKKSNEYAVTSCHAEVQPFAFDLKLSGLIESP